MLFRATEGAGPSIRRVCPTSRRHALPEKVPSWYVCIYVGLQDDQHCNWRAVASIANVKITKTLPAALRPPGCLTIMTPI
jgi:hypothetical protein